MCYEREEFFISFEISGHINLLAAAFRLSSHEKKLILRPLKASSY